MHPPNHLRLVTAIQLLFLLLVTAPLSRAHITTDNSNKNHNVSPRSIAKIQVSHVTTTATTPASAPVTAPTPPADTPVKAPTPPADTPVTAPAPPAVAPAAEPKHKTPAPVDLIAVMSAHGCKSFADAVKASPEAMSVFNDNVAGGVTVFCPDDDAFKSFAPKLKNLTAAEKASLYESHGIPIYQSKPMLRSSNGDTSTLATDGADKYSLTVQNDGDQVTLKTKLVTARITVTVHDKDPVAVFAIDKVLLPVEIFSDELPAPAPEPADDAADAPEPAKGKKKKTKKHDDSPAESPGDEDPADATADGNGGGEGLSVFGGAGIVSVLIGLFTLVL